MLPYIKEGTRITLSSLRQRFFPKKYSGTAEQICQKIIEECWNGRYFQTSTGNFPHFWTRDFGWCIKSLLKLGYKEQVQKTVRYALNTFRHAKKITTTIAPSGKPFDFPVPSIDSLPWFIHCLRLSKISYHEYRNFLNTQIKYFYNNLTDNGKPKKGHFSSMKDLSIRDRPCYDACMIAMLAEDLKHLKLINPFTNDTKQTVMEYWNGEYFYDDMQQQEYIAGDANVFPFICGITKEKEKLRKVINSIQNEKLDEPLPLKYTKKRIGKFVWQELFLLNYETHAQWAHMGPFYIKLLQQIDPKRARELKQQYTNKILKYKTFHEVYHNDKPYRYLWYYSSGGMLWAANHLNL